MILKYVAAPLIVLLCAILVVRLMRFAAALLIVIIPGAGCGFVLYNVGSKEWIGWSEIGLYSAATGVVVAVLMLPLMPFIRSSRRDST